MEKLLNFLKRDITSLHLFESFANDRHFVERLEGLVGFRQQLESSWSGAAFEVAIAKALQHRAIASVAFRQQRLNRLSQVVHSFHPGPKSPLNSLAKCL